MSHGPNHFSSDEEAEAHEVTGNPCGWEVRPSHTISLELGLLSYTSVISNSL